MKIPKLLIATALAAFTLTACNQQGTSEDSDTIVEEDNREAEPPVDNTDQAEDEASSIGFDVDADEEGNVNGQLEGDIKLDDK